MAQDKSALVCGGEGLVGQAVPAVCSLVASGLGKVVGEGGNGLLNQMVFL